MMRYVTVAGTHGGWGDGWWSAHSPWREHMRSLGWQPFEHPFGEFQWSGDIDGVWRIFGGKDWEAGARAFVYFMAAVPPDVAVISHSHALQVVLHSAASGVKVPLLIDVAGPVRKDMLTIAEKAKPQIAQWIHLYDKQADWMAWLGQFTDGRLFGGRDHPLATNVPLDGVGHSGVLNDPKHFHFWSDTILPAVEQGV